MLPLSLLCAWTCLASDLPQGPTLLPGLYRQPEVLVQSQGWAQHDLSIRGSSYTGTGLSLNGLNLKVPYSAHFNSELPLYSGQLSTPAPAIGPRTVSGHPAGTVAYHTVPQPQGFQAEAGAGSKSRYQVGVSVFTSGIGGYLNGQRAREVDYEANDYDRYAGGAHLQQLVSEWQIDLLGAGQRKEFGAQGYYGIPADQYARQQTEDMLLFIGATKGERDDAFLRAGAAWRQFDDEYATAGRFSDVRSRYGTAAVEGRTMEIQHLALTLRGDVEYEAVDGTVGSEDRTRASMLLLPEIRLERLLFRAGLNTVFQTAESAELLPVAEAEWSVTDNSRFYAAYSEHARQPDYQTLENNPLLQQQQTANTELGFRQFLSAAADWRLAGFSRRLRHASDWIGGGATDLGTLDTAGLESAVRYYPSEQLYLTLFYQWLHKDTGRNDGLYELDYPEHQLNVSAVWHCLSELAVEFTQTTRYQADNSLRTGPDFGAQASLGLHYFPRFAHNARLSFLVDNLWDSDFQTLPGLKPRPITFFTGITAAW